MLRSDCGPTGHPARHEAPRSAAVTVRIRGFDGGGGGGSWGGVVAGGVVAGGVVAGGVVAGGVVGAGGGAVVVVDVLVLVVEVVVVVEEDPAAAARSERELELAGPNVRSARSCARPNWAAPQSNAISSRHTIGPDNCNLRGGLSEGRAQAAIPSACVFSSSANR